MASSSDCDKVAAVPFAAPSEACKLSCAPVAACRVGSRLSISAAILVASNTRSFGFCGGCGGAALASALGTGFLASSCLSASAIGSTLGGSGFFSIGFGSSFGLVSGTGFGGTGFFSPRFFPRRLWQRGFGFDRRLFGDLSDGVIDRLCVGDLLDQRFRLVLFAALAA